MKDTRHMKPQPAENQAVSPVDKLQNLDYLAIVDSLNKSLGYTPDPDIIAYLKEERKARNARLASKRAEFDAWRRSGTTYEFTKIYRKDTGLGLVDDFEVEGFENALDLYHIYKASGLERGLHSLTVLLDGKVVQKCRFTYKH